MSIVDQDCLSCEFYEACTIAGDASKWRMLVLLLPEIVDLLGEEMTQVNH